MLEFFSDVFHWIAQVPPFWAYVAILVIAYGENVIPPIPGDMIVVYGGYLAASGKLDLPIVVLLSTIGGALGFMTMYAIGHRIGDAVLERNRLRWLPKERIRAAQEWLERWGLWVVSANRFLSGARSVISLTVGMARIDTSKTTLCATLSAFVWTALIAYGGYQLGENWTLIGSYLRAYGTVISIIGATATAIVTLRYYVRWRRGVRERGANRGDSPHGGGRSGTSSVDTERGQQ